MSSPDDYRQAYLEAIHAANQAFIAAQNAAFTAFNAARKAADHDNTAAMVDAVIVRDNAISAANAVMIAAAEAEHHRKIIRGGE